MAKRFVEFDEFKKELKSLRSDIEHLDKAVIEVADNLDTTIDVVNTNGTGCEELEKRLNELTQRFDKLSRRCQVMQTEVNAKNTDGLGVALVVGAIGFVLFVVVMNKIDELEKKIKALKSNQEARRYTETFREANTESGKEG